jgi:hypothetical protein
MGIDCGALAGETSYEGARAVIDVTSGGDKVEAVFRKAGGRDKPSSHSFSITGPCREPATVNAWANFFISRRIRGISESAHDPSSTLIVPRSFDR